MLEDHLERCRRNLTYPLATWYHAMGTVFQQGLVQAGQFQASRTRLWVAVPEPHREDEQGSGLSLFFKGLAETGGNPAAFRRLAELSFLERFTQRSKAAEYDVLATIAERFQTVREESPLPLRPLSPAETFSEVFRSHNPATPDAAPDGIDLEAPLPLPPYLCLESVNYEGGWYALHDGVLPVAVVSLVQPPNEPVRADAVRRFLRAGVRLHHTIITEYIVGDVEADKKEMDRLVRSVNRWSSNGKLKEPTPEQAKKEQTLRAIRDHLGEPGCTLARTRVHIVVYGEPFTTFKEKKQSLDDLRQACKTFQSILRGFGGATGVIETEADLKELYPRLMVGEFASLKRSNGREIRQLTRSVAALTLLETAWTGSARPHTILSTTSGRLFGLNLLKAEGSNSKFAYCVAGTGGGKSVLAATIADGFLATYPDSQVWFCDFGSFRTFTRVLDGLSIRFDRGDVVNSFEYDGLEAGLEPTVSQKRLVVQDICNLGEISGDVIMVGLITDFVEELYRTTVATNRSSPFKLRPRLSDLLDIAETFALPEGLEGKRLELLARLKQYHAHPVVDAPTSDHLRHSSKRVRCYDFESLKTLEPVVCQAMAFRIMASMLELMNTTQAGVKTPKLFIFDEGDRIRNEFPIMFKAANITGRGGRKNNLIGLFLTQDYTDLADIHGLVNNAGTRIIGVQEAADFPELVRDCQLPPEAVTAIREISNRPGESSQFLIVQGSGRDKNIELVENILSPIHLWTFTTEPEETNAFERLCALRPQHSAFDNLVLLATAYPRGLIFAGLSCADIQWDRLLASA
ncbi:MAG: hypothetical protein K1Y36_18690 [Blastocatellia bacterium]|nr:hypothetical protein [Blastocatellia bacterium]